MPSIDAFRKWGFFCVPAFLDPPACADLCEHARAAPALPAEIVGAAGRFVDQADRNTWEISSTGEREDAVVRRVEALRDELAGHFGVALSGCEGAKLLVYRTGGFYRPHRDRVVAEGDAVVRARARCVSIVIFLNGTSADPGPGEYAGGKLTFYGLMGDPQWWQYGFALDPAPGLLVAFRSDIVHEVTPVLAGERYTIVDWFGDE